MDLWSELTLGYQVPIHESQNPTLQFDILMMLSL